MAINFNQLGVHVDGWADVVPGVGAKATEARGHLERIVRERNMPATTVDPAIVTASAFASKQRPYLRVEMPNGASVVVYLGEFGQDLYATWESYLRPVLNQTAIAWILIAAAGLALLGNIETRSSFSNGGINFLGWIIGTVTNAVAITILVGLAGLALRGNILAFFFKELDKFDLDDIGAMTLVVHRTVLEALDCVGIQTTSVRLKEQFRAGSRERLI